MNFSDPREFLWLILFTTLIGLAFWALRQKSVAVLQLMDSPVLAKIFPFQNWRKAAFRRILFSSLGLLFLILAMAGPQLGQKFEEVKTKGNNLFILFDISDSMLAEDFKPTRLEKSKRLLSGLLDKLHGNRVGIIAFAGEAYVYCPLTFDLTTVRQFLKSIEPGMIPQPGTHIGTAVKLALSKMSAQKSGAIVLLTDGEDHKSEPLKAAEEAKSVGVRIFAIGIGNPEGEPIPMRDAAGNISGYKKKKNGEVVLSKVDEETLSKMAQETGGAYFRASESEQEIDVLADQLEQMGQNPMTQKLNVYENRYQWFALPALLFLLLGEGWAFLLDTRKSARLAAALLAFLLLQIQPLRADSFRGKMNEGAKLYKEKQYYEALKNFEGAEQAKPDDARAHFNQGTAHYQLKEWDKAKEELEKGTASKSSRVRAKSFYNLGNSQFQAQDYSGAAKSYRESLKLEPSDADARFNYQLALQLVANPPQKQKQQQKQDENKKDKDQKGAKQDEQQKEKEENAKRVLKGAAGDENNKPIFNPNSKDKKKNKDDEEDW